MLAFGLGLWMAGPGGWQSQATGSSAAESTFAGPEPGPLTADASRAPRQLPPDPRDDAAAEASKPQKPTRPEERPAAAAPPASRPERKTDQNDTALREPEAALPEQAAESLGAAPTSVADAAARASRADRLAENGNVEDARLEAEALLAAHGSFTGLTSALIEGGTEELQAHLSALRILQLAGLDAETTELARELKRTHAGTPDVLEAIRRWRLLTPRITRLDTSVEDGGWVLVSGTLENPDIGEVRRVRVQVEALDAAGNVLTTTRARIRPKRLAPGGTGSFTVRFDELDPASVLRTRATVLEWESEVLGPS